MSWIQVVPSTFAENLEKEDPALYARKTASCKSRQVFEHLLRSGDVPDIVIAADTVVEHNGEILEKPEDEDDARRMLKDLRGSHHLVHSGVSVVCRNEHDVPFREVCSFTETTDVYFCMYSDEDIEEYVRSKEPFGKAGSYGIQTSAASFVKGIHGCYFNVVGFPIHRFLSELDLAIEWL